MDIPPFSSILLILAEARVATNRAGIDVDGLKRTTEELTDFKSPIYILPM